MRQMNPYASPYPTDPTFAVIGEGLGRALFGDPAARQAQQQAEAERQLALARVAQARSAAGYDDARTSGVNLQNDASSNLVKLLTEGFAPQPAPVDMSTGGSLADVVSSLGAGAGMEEQGILPPPPVVAPSADERLRSLAPVLFGTMAQMQGDKVDPNGVIGGLAAMIGSEEFARRGMVAQGKTPDKDFALTADRADDIRAQGYGAEYKKATDVATINNASDIPVAEIRARGGVQEARIRADGTVEAAGVRSGGTDRGTRNNNPGNIKDGPYARSQPGYTGNDGGGFAVFSSAAAGSAAQENLLTNNYISKGHDTPRKVIARYAPAGENSSASMNNYAAYVARRLGIGLDDKIPPYSVALLGQAMREFETGKRPSGTTATAKPAASGKAPKPIPVSVSKALDEKVGALIDDVFAGHSEASRKKVASGWRARAGRYYQRYGDTGQVTDQLRKDMIAANATRGGKPKVDLKKKYGLE